MKKFNKFDPNENDLHEKAFNVVNKMSKNQKWQMCVPPQLDDADMTLVRIIDGFNIYKRKAESAGSWGRWCARLVQRRNHLTKALTDTQDKHDELLKLIKEFQGDCRYGSPWWFKIETVINPDNPVLKEDKEY